MIQKNTNIILTLFICLLQQLLIAQIKVEEEPKMLYWEQTHRVKKLKEAQNFRDVFHKDRYLMGKNRISGNISYNTGRVSVEDEQHVVHDEMRNALGFYTRIRFFEEFSVNASFFKDFNHVADTRWIADYTYSVGRYNWRPNKFNYGYENYINNKYTDNFKTFTQKFLEGYYFISYNNSLPQKLTKIITIDSSTSFKVITFVRYSIKYRDEFEKEHGSFFHGKPTAGAGFRFTILRNIYIESAFYLYYKPSLQKQPWDPDYSYGFGYFDWHSFRCSLTYGNWAVNRFPWNKTVYSRYGFLDGNFRFIINYIW